MTAAGETLERWRSEKTAAYLASAVAAAESAPRNAELFRERVSEAVAASPTAVNWVVVAAEPVTSIDVTASDSLAELIDDLRARGITFRFAELKDPVKDKLKRFGLFAELGEAAFYPTVGAAVSGYVDSHDVDWKDDEDR